MNRTYLIINVSELDKVDFSQILETSIDTVRRSVDGTKTFIKWDTVEPDFLDQLTTKEGPYSTEEMMSILSTSDWVFPPLDPTSQM